MSLSLRFVTHSEIGLIRKNNQDSGFASPRLLVVADGMGGAAAGDLASAVAVDTIRRIEDRVDGREMLEVLAGAIHRANDRISDLVEADGTLDGMGTTVTGALFDGTELGLAHIGDSRAYLFRDGRLKRLTHDHSWVQSLVDEGKISDAEAAVHPHRSLLLKVLNGQPANDPDLAMITVFAGDRVLFCSDGVCGLIDDPTIASALRLPDLDDALHQLVADALAEGGIDNITAILAEVVETGGTTTDVVLGAAAERDIPAPESLVRADTAEEEGEEVAGSPEPVPDEARYSPLPPGRRRFIRPVLGLLALLLIIAAGLSAAYAWTRTQYFVGTSGNNVAIYQGLSEGLPGIPLSRIFEVQQLTVSELPPYYQDKVRANIDVGSLGSARQTVTELSDAAKRCAAQGSGSTPSARPTTKPTTKPTGKPTPSATATPTGSADSTC
jgi:serine/threonine protein phosphatase PrpC